MSGFFAKSRLRAVVLSLCAAAVLVPLVSGCPDVTSYTPTTTPVTVTNASAVAGNAKVIVFWATSGSTSVTVTSSSGYSQSFAAGTNSCVVTGLTNGTSYTFTVSNSYNLQTTEAVTPTLTAEGDDSADFQYNYSEATPYKEIASNENFVYLKGVKGKTILFANINTTDTALPAAYARIATGFSDENQLEDSSPDSFSISAQRTARSLVDGTPLTDIPDDGIRHFVPPTSIRVTGSPARDSSSDNGNFNVSLVAGDAIGDTQLQNGTYYKYVYLDNNVNLNNFSKQRVTLRAIGKSGGAVKCLLWVADSCYITSGNATGKNVNLAVAQDLANKFATYCDSERSVFGEESEFFVASPDGKTIVPSSVPLSSAVSAGGSDTSDYVNIVIYDIGNDYGKSSQSGVVGYFYAKDYFQVGDYGSGDIRSISNGGKYFYIDAPFCNYKKVDNKTTYNGNSNKASDTVVSTLFHEFQHMINFNQKDILHYDTIGDVPTWYNEMLSMLAEDMMQEQLTLSDEEAPRGSRLPAFNMYYWMSGATDYLDGSDAVLSYSSAYAFGAWVTRTYGGPSLVKEMSTNNSAGLDSVLTAIEAHNPGTTFTDGGDGLIKEYVKACAFRTTFAQGKSLPTFYKDATGSIGANRMTKINLFGSAYGYTPLSSSTQKYYGPLLFKQGQRLDVRPHGFVLHSVGTAASDNITLVFSPTQGDQNANQVMIFIQDAFDNKVEDLSEE